MTKQIKRGFFDRIWNLNGKISDLFFEMDQLFTIIALYAKKRGKQKSQSYPSSVQCLFTIDDTRESKAVIGEAEKFLFLLLDFTHALKKRYEWLVTKWNINPFNKRQF